MIDAPRSSQISPWGAIPSKILYISLSIDRASNYGQEMSERLIKMGLAPNSPHISVCKIHIRTDSELDIWLSQLNDKEFKRIVVKPIKSMILGILKGHQLKSINPVTGMENYGILRGEWVTSIFDNPDIDIGSIITGIINRLLSYTSNQGPYSQVSSHVKGRIFECISNDGTVENAQIAIGENEISVWLAHVSIARAKSREEAIKIIEAFGHAYSRRPLIHLNLWPSTESGQIKYTNVNGVVGSFVENGDIQHIYVAYGDRHMVIKFD